MVLTIEYICEDIDQKLIMYKWDPASGSPDFLAVDLQDPIYGFSYDKNPVTRAMAATDTEGFSQFQPTLLDHKNDTDTVEYNPLDVFSNATRYKTTVAKPRQTRVVRKTPNIRSGYLLYSQEMRPIIQRRNPDLSFGELTKMVAQMWNELSSVEQEDYCQRARVAGDQPEQQEMPGQEMYVFGIAQNQGHGDDVGIVDPGAGGLYNMSLGNQFNG